MTIRHALIAVVLVVLSGVAYLFDLHHYVRFDATPPAPIPASSQADRELVGKYYFGDGLGVNQTLKLHADGTFDCDWTGCLGDYGSSRGTWARDGDTLVVSTTTADGMFTQSPLENMTILQHGGKPHFLEEGWRSFIEEFGDDAIPDATFSPMQ